MLDTVRTGKNLLDTVRTGKNLLDTVRTGKNLLDTVRTGKNLLDTVRTGKNLLDTVRTGKKKILHRIFSLFIIFETHLHMSSQMIQIITQHITSMHMYQKKALKIYQFHLQ